MPKINPNQQLKATTPIDYSVLVKDPSLLLASVHRQLQLQHQPNPSSNHHHHHLYHQQLQQQLLHKTNHSGLSNHKMPPPAPKYDKRSVNSNGDETIGKRKTLLDFFGKGSQQQQQKQIRIDSKTITRPSIIHQELKLSNNKSVPNVIDLSDEDDLNNLNGNNGYFKSPTVPKSKGVSANRKDNKQKQQQQQQSLNQRKNNNIGSSQEIEIIEDEDDLNVISFKTPMLPHRNETKSPMVNSPYPYYQPIKSLWREPVKDDEEIRIEKLKEKNFIKIEDFLQIVIDTKGDVSELNSESKENDPPQVEWQKDYKLKHFRDMIDSVLKDNHYSHLFDDHDWDALYKFTNLSCKFVTLNLSIFHVTLKCYKFN